jgi:hypothetical protein
VVVETGETVIEGVVSPPGLQRNVGFAALWVTVSVAEPSGQIFLELTLTIDVKMIVTVPDPEPEQPVNPSVTVTVYVVVLSGATVIEAVVAPPGLHR